MTVYVDPSRPWPGYRRGDGTVVHSPHRWCHLWADAPAELHRFAAGLGLKRAWFQDRTGLPHYDLMGERMRDRAIAAGARALSSEESILQRRKRAAAAAPPTRGASGR